MTNHGVIDLLAEWFESLGFQCSIQPLTPKKSNLVATFGAGEGGLLLSGHTDTVPFDEHVWQHNPLVLTPKDNRLYGLGTCDMKSFFALIIEAVIPLLSQPFNAPLTIVATADEESSMAGARALTKQQLPNPKAAIIGEPTNLAPIRLHKGMAMPVITFTGTSGHSSNPTLGHNALDAMHDAITVLKQLRNTWQHRYQHPLFTIAYPTMNLGCIHGGDNPNRICRQCTLQLDLRTIPQVDNHDLLMQMQQALQPVADKHQVHMDFSSLITAIEAFEEPAGSPLISMAESVCNQTAFSVAYATEAPFLQSLGIETVVLGPGSIDQAHQADEFIALDQLDACVKTLRRFIEYYCLTPLSLTPS